MNPTSLLTPGARRDLFLAELAAATQPLTAPDEVMAISARLLAEHLGVDRCAYAPVEEERVFVITGDYSRGPPSIVGRWNVDAFGAGCVHDMLAGIPYVVEDSERDPRISAADREAYRATQIRAVICVPLHKQGRFTAAMAVHQVTPRRFTAEEIDLVTIVVARCWEALERVNADRVLVQNRARLDYAVRLSGVGFWYCPLPFEELIWDERVKEHFFLPSTASGITMDDFFGRMHPDDREKTRSAIEAAIAERRSYDTIYRTVDPESGRIKWIRALGGAAYAKDGTPTNFDGVTLDVTAQKSDEARLADALARVSEQDRRKDEFLATLAHELRNPLAPISTGLQVLRGTHNADQLARTREMMERQLRHLVRMVDDLMDASRITLGKVRLQRERLDFRGVVHSALETTRSLVDAQGHTLTLRLPDAPLPVDGDPVRLAQVIANLVHNAAKYTPAGGSIELAATLESGTLAMSVKDSGIGIPADTIASIFDLFVQGKRSVAQSQGGLGIGLTLVRGILELHGGSIEASSAGDGLGSTFTLRLPLARSDSDHAPTNPTAEVAERRRVLVVDDNVDAADSLAMLLEIAGHATQIANTGEDALLVAQEFRPDVIFLDIGLPGMSGYEVARELRADPQMLAGLKIFALTGWGSEEDRRRANAAGFDRHLVKPVSPEDLAAAFAPS